jgi:hypothetical protein
MYNEKKFIIVKQYNRIRHFIFPSCLFHDTFARDNGFYFNDVLETGLIRNGRIVIVECRVKEHLPRVEHKSLFSEQELKARSCESLYAYGYIRQGD